MREDFGVLQKDNAQVQSQVSKLQAEVQAIGSKQGEISVTVGEVEEVVLDLGKLQNKFYGPFVITQRVGKVAYKLQFLDHVKIHPVFHVSQLKKHIGSKSIPSKNLPMVTADGTVKTGPTEVLQVKQVPRQNMPVVQWYIQWEKLPLEDARGRMQIS
ncbi:hypothetical protein VPH35_072977 [Triticum aestivum]